MICRYMQIKLTPFQCRLVCLQENLSLNRIRLSYACTDTLTAGHQQQSAISLGMARDFSRYSRRSKRDCTNRFTHVAICPITAATCQSKSEQNSLALTLLNLYPCHSH